MDDSISLTTTIPTFLYRFFNWNRGIEFLASQKLHLSTVSFYNDPFEYFPASKYTDVLLLHLSEDQLREYIKDKMKSIAENLEKDKELLDSLEKKKSFTQKVLDNRKLAPLVAVGAKTVLANTARVSALKMGAATLATSAAIPFGTLLTAAAIIGAAAAIESNSKAKKLNDVKQDLIKNENEKEYLSRFNAFVELYFKSLIHIKTCCFSTKNDDILLWSHYAEQHKGLSIAFNTESLCSRGLDFKEINYVNKRVQIPSADDISTSFISNLITSKAKHWKYEKEWRLIMYDAGKINSIDIDPTAIESIYLGLRVTDDQSDAIKRIRDNIYKQAKIKRAKMDNETFKLRFEDC